MDNLDGKRDAERAEATIRALDQEVAGLRALLREWEDTREGRTGIFIRLRAQADRLQEVGTSAIEAVDALRTSNETLGRIQNQLEDRVGERTAELATSEARLRAIVAASPDPVITIDTSGRVQSFNPAAESVFGYTAAEVIGRNVSMLMPSPFREEHDSYVARYLKTGEARIIGIGRTVEGLRKNGEVFPMQLTVADARSEGERLFVGFVQDLTEEQRAQSQIQQLQAELMHASRLAVLGEINSAVAHEIAQPLTAIGNYVNAIKIMIGRSATINPATIGDVLAKIIDQGERASTVMQRLRAMARKSEPATAVVDVRGMIEEAITLGFIDARQKGVDVEIGIRNGTPPVMADKVQIQQVLFNLFRNAVDAMADSQVRRIRIEARPADNLYVEITVADTGPGVAEEMQPHLFAPFQTTKASGMGIGLSICRSIVEAHGGAIGYEPNPDSGAVFRFTVPAAE